MNPRDFITLMTIPAQHSASITKIPAGFTIADAALESGWGTSRLFMLAKNIFGVKANPSWKGQICVMQTREYMNKQWIKVPAKWRLYATFDECLADHAMFLLTNKRYAGCFPTTTGEAFATAVAAAGYATDPDYAKKIIAILHQYNIGD